MKFDGGLDRGGIVFMRIVVWGTVEFSARPKAHYGYSALAVMS